VSHLLLNYSLPNSLLPFQAWVSLGVKNSLGRGFWFESLLLQSFFRFILIII